MARVDLDALTDALGMVAVRAPSGDQELVIVLYAMEQAITELRAAREVVEVVRPDHDPTNDACGVCVALGSYDKAVPDVHFSRAVSRPWP